MNNCMNLNISLVVNYENNILGFKEKRIEENLENFLNILKWV